MVHSYLLYQALVVGIFLFDAVSLLYTAVDKCFLPPSVGACSMPRYFYNASALECQRFIYGGCDGNSNNFESMKLCEEECERPLSPGEPLVPTGIDKDALAPSHALDECEKFMSAF